MLLCMFCCISNCCRVGVGCGLHPFAATIVGVGVNASGVCCWGSTSACVVDL